MVAEDFKKEVLSAGFAKTAGNADDGEVRVANDAVSDGENCEVAADELVGLDEKQGKKKKGKGFESEDGSENQVNREREKENDGQKEKKGYGENELNFEGVNQGFFGAGLESEGVI